MAAMIRIIATTISSSIREKPFCARITIFLSWLRWRSVRPQLPERKNSPNLRIFLVEGLGGPNSNYFLRRRIRTSKLTTPL